MIAAIEAALQHDVAGDPITGIRWTRRTTEKIAIELATLDIQVCPRTVDLHSDDEAVFRDIQRIKERDHVNVELARPEHFVPPLAGAADRHVFIATFGAVSFFHYDPYSQLLSKVVRGFRRDIEDAQRFVASGMVEVVRFRELVAAIPETAYAKYPALSRKAVGEVVNLFVSGVT